MFEECERCQSKPTHIFSFYYGKTLGHNESWHGNTKIYSTAYDISGEQEVWLCRKCSSRNSRDWLQMIAYYLIGLALCAAAVFLWQLTQNHHALVILVFLFGFIGLSLLYFCTKDYIFKSAKTIGEEKAIKFKKETLESRGYDSFFTAKRYRELQKK